MVVLYYFRIYCVWQEFLASKVLRRRTLSAFVGGTDEQKGQNMFIIALGWRLFICLYYVDKWLLCVHDKFSSGA